MIKEHSQILNRGVTAWNNWRVQFPSIKPDLRGMDLRFVMLRGVNFTNTNLSGVDLRDANLRHANLDNAFLDQAKLHRAFLSNARLHATSFKRSILYETVFADVDLSNAKDLDTCLHKGPSIIDHRTLSRSIGLPREFLRGCGLPDFIINETITMPRDAHKYNSCFISYSSKDQTFAERLYDGLQNSGVRCWFAPEDLKIGEKIRIGIDESIRKQDKLLLILSKDSVLSEWVEQEVETAMAREREEKRLVLFPIRLDDTIMTINSGWPSLIKNTRNIGDFRYWNDDRFYGKAFSRLLHDLQAR